MIPVVGTAASIGINVGMGVHKICKGKN